MKTEYWYKLFTKELKYHIWIVAGTLEEAEKKARRNCLWHKRTYGRIEETNEIVKYTRFSI